MSSPSEATQFTVNRQPKITVRRKSPYSQAIELQDVAMECCQNADVTPAAKSQLMRAWLELERVKREIKMKPKPKPVEVSIKPKSQHQAAEPIE